MRRTAYGQSRGAAAFLMTRYPGLNNRNVNLTLFTGVQLLFFRSQRKNFLEAMPEAIPLGDLSVITVCGLIALNFVFNASMALIFVIIALTT